MQIGLSARAMERARKLRQVVRLRPHDQSTEAGRSAERYRRIALTTATGLAARGVGLAIGLISVPLIFNFLGKAQYGLWATISSILMWATIFNFGIGNGLVNALSQAHGKDDPAAARRYVSTALVLLCAVAALLGAAFALIAPFVAWDWLLASDSVATPDEVRRSITAAMAAFLLGLPLTIVPQIYAAYQRAYVANIAAVVGSIATLGGLLVAVNNHAPLWVLILVFGGGSLVVMTASLVWLLQVEMPWLAPRWSGFTRDALKGLAATSGPIFLFQVGALFVNQTQLIVLAHTTNYKVVAEYSILMQLYLLAIGLIWTSTNSFLPAFREAYERGDRFWAHRGFARLVGVRMAMATVAAIGLLGLGNWAIRVWLRQPDMQFGWEVWAALGVCMLAATWASTYADFLTIMDRLWVLVGLVVVNAVTVVSVTLVATPRMGALGAIIALTCLPLFVWTWAGPVLVRRLLPWLRGGEGDG